jgi:hypothetical protein
LDLFLQRLMIQHFHRQYPYCWLHLSTQPLTTILTLFLPTGAYRGGGWGVQTPPPPKFLSFDKAEPNSQFRGKYIRNNLIRIRVSLICKLSGTPDSGATAPRSPFSLPSVLN